MSFRGRRLTYLQLERAANRLAHRLRALGAARGATVGVCLERSPEMLIAFLAVAKAGAAYVPLDPRDPPARSARQARDAGVGLLLSLARHRDQVGWSATAPVFLDDELDLAREPDTPPEPQARAGDPAYVMFTSGSTGTPKGVQVPHRAVVRLARSADYVSLGPGEVLLGLAPATFDASTFEIWGALLNGARLALAPPGALSLLELDELLRDEAVTTLWLAAGLLHRVVDGRPESLRSVRQLLSGGDVLSADHVARALAALPPGAVMVNGYGPTETTTFACAHRMRRGEPPVGARERRRLGRPVSVDHRGAGGQRGERASDVIG